MRYLGNLVRDELGYSFVQRRPFLRIMALRAAATSLLTRSAVMVATLEGVWLGKVSAWRPFSSLERATNEAPLLVFSIPVFWLAQFLICFFAVRLGMLRAQSLFQSPWSCVGLPTITLPCSLSGSGLPLSLQLLAPPFAGCSPVEAAAWCHDVLGNLPTPPS